MKVFLLLLLTAIQWITCQQTRTEQFMAHVEHFCNEQLAESAPRILEELQALQDKVEALQEVLHWYAASNGYFYKLIEERKTFPEARAECERRGAILAAAGMRDEAVRNELMAMANGRSTFIGVSDIVQEGRWVWDDGVVSSGNDINWYPGEPNDRRGEDCVYIFRVSGTWKANDSPCNQTYSDIAQFFCEKSL